MYKSKKLNSYSRVLLTSTTLILAIPALEAQGATLVDDRRLEELEKMARARKELREAGGLNKLEDTCLNLLEEAEKKFRETSSLDITEALLEYDGATEKTRLEKALLKRVEEVRNGGEEAPVTFSTELAHALCGRLQKIEGAEIGFGLTSIEKGLLGETRTYSKEPLVFREKYDVLREEYEDQKKKEWAAQKQADEIKLRKAAIEGQREFIMNFIAANKQSLEKTKIEIMKFQEDIDNQLTSHTPSFMQKFWSLFIIQPDKARWEKVKPKITAAQRGLQETLDSIAGALDGVNKQEEALNKELKEINSTLSDSESKIEDVNKAQEKLQPIQDALEDRSDLSEKIKKALSSNKLAQAKETLEDAKIILEASSKDMAGLWKEDFEKIVPELKKKKKTDVTFSGGRATASKDL